MSRCFLQDQGPPEQQLDSRACQGRVDCFNARCHTTEESICWHEFSSNCRYISRCYRRASQERCLRCRLISPQRPINVQTQCVSITPHAWDSLFLVSQPRITGPFVSGAGMTDDNQPRRVLCTAVSRLVQAIARSVAQPGRSQSNGQTGISSCISKMSSSELHYMTAVRYNIFTPQSSRCSTLRTQSY